MRHRLVRIDPLCAARLVAVLYFLLGLLLLPFFYLKFVSTPIGVGFSPLVVFAEPFLFSGIGFATTVLACGLFNTMAGRFGGLEIELVDEGIAS